VEVNGSVGTELAEAVSRARALEQRIAHLRAFGNLRRSLRVAEEVEEIASVAQRFALEDLRSTHFAIYCAEKEEADFTLISSAQADAGSEPIALPPSIERVGDLAQALDTAPVVRGMGPLEAFAEAHGAIALPLRASPTLLIGIAILAGASLEMDLLDELAFDVESALASRLVARLRAEELAVLEIQERELVGLLRDVEARDAIIQRDLEEARQFQRKMLGAAPQLSGVAIEVVYEPLGLVGGDLYALTRDGDRLRVLVADATGHGVRASLTTMFIKSGYEAVCANAADPASLLAALNDAIAHKYRSSEMLFSAACIDLDLVTGHVILSSAAHPAICVVKNGQATFMEGAGAFLGLRAGMSFKNDEITIAPGDGVYLYTDGFPEARKQNELFGDDRLRDTIVDAHAREALAGAALVEAVTKFLEGSPLDDDGTFVGVRFRAPEVGNQPSERRRQSGAYGSKR
jgi:serine phosphatase RsbU (regulator of sigma subunit)